jgi:Na+/H+ antiporter NhaD/arsenite permease-like protein
MNPREILLMIPESEAAQRYLERMSINISVVEVLIFFIALFAVNWALYKMGYIEGFNRAVEEIKNKNVRAIMEKNIKS